jgi:tRNA(fMet)-specific endonuclease VapC
MSKVLLDTNAYSAFLRGDQSVLGALAEAEFVYVPLFVIGELQYGFRGGKHLNRNLTELRAFMEKPTVHLWLATAETPQIYGEIMDRLKRAGTPIPINDVWIASAGIETGSKLITYDQHFHSVPGLRIWDRGV